MEVTVEDLELEVREGTTVAQIVAFARERGTFLPDQPWCGSVRMHGQHPVGSSPLVAFSRLTARKGPDARPDPGVHLAVVGGEDAGAVATLAEGLEIGREPTCGLALTDRTVSLRHARFERGKLRDLGSRNGLRTARGRVRLPSRIRPGLEVRLGATTLSLVAPGVTEKEPPRSGSRWRTVGTSLLGSATMAGFAIVTGHWPLAIVAIAIPLVAVAIAMKQSRERDPRESPLNVTGTLPAVPFPRGAVAVRGPVGLLRAVTLAVGRPQPTAPHWEAWMALLPEARDDVRWLQGDETAPSWVEVEVQAIGDSALIDAHGTSHRVPLPLVSQANADAVARRIAARSAQSAVPRSIRWGQLPKPTGPLTVRLGMSAEGPVALDLVADGPHLLVAGTTGSGKSEALRTIVASLAYDYSPAALNFALIDFKGGAGLGPLARLPHVSSTLTDLDPHLSRRCLLALAAELADRKRAAATARVTTYDAWDEARPPRLVIVIDEFQEIASADREFLPELARLAAQGRSLGVHLVLATQRPAGAVGAEIRANISATLALRTSSEAESRDLIGTGAAAEIPAELPGRAVLARGTRADVVQVALPLADEPPAIYVSFEPPPMGRDLTAAAAQRHAERARPLWLPPLPTMLAPPTAADGFVLGVADAPATRSRAEVRWEPAAGPLIVFGRPRSGRSTVLASIAAMTADNGGTPVHVPADPRLALRTLDRAPHLPNAVLLVDDASNVLSSASAIEPDVLDALASLMSRMPVAIVVPASWAHHRLIAQGSLMIAMAGLDPTDDAAWEIPKHLRSVPASPGRARVRSADGWTEAQLVMASTRPVTPLVRPLPATASGELPPSAIGIGGDLALPIEIPSTQAAVVGPPSPEREAIARRISIASGTRAHVADNAFALTAPGSSAPRTVVCVRPTARSLREVLSAVPRGLIDPTPVPFRAVVVVDGIAQCVQVLPA